MVYEELCSDHRYAFLIVAIFVEAVITAALFSGLDCLFEKARGKHDVLNGGLSGCATGAILAVKQGPQAAGLGCAGFAAFSIAIDALMHESD